MAQKLIESIVDPIDVRYNIQQFKISMVEQYVDNVLHQTQDVDQIIQKMVDLIKMNNYDRDLLDIMSQYLHELSFKDKTVNLVTADNSWMYVLGLENDSYLLLYPAYQAANEKYNIR